MTRKQARPIFSLLSASLGLGSLACGAFWIFPFLFPMGGPLGMGVIWLGVLLGTGGILAGMAGSHDWEGQLSLVASLLGTSLCLGWRLFWQL